MQYVSTMGSGSFGRDIELEAFTEALQDTLHHEPDPNFTSSGMVTTRLEPDGPAYTFYRTGAFQIRGATDDEELLEAEQRLKEVLDEIGFEPEDYSFEPKTSVFMEDLDQGISLETLVLVLGMENVEYEPEQFPGLVYQPTGENVTALVFASGKIIVTGTTDEEVAETVFEELQEEVSRL